MRESLNEVVSKMLRSVSRKQEEPLTIPALGLGLCPKIINRKFDINSILKTGLRLSLEQPVPLPIMPRCLRIHGGNVIDIRIL